MQYLISWKTRKNWSDVKKIPTKNEIVNGSHIQFIMEMGKKIHKFKNIFWSFAGTWCGVPWMRIREIILLMLLVMYFEKIFFFFFWILHKALFLFDINKYFLTSTELLGCPRMLQNLCSRVVHSPFYYYFFLFSDIWHIFFFLMARDERMEFFKKLDRQNWMGPRWMLRRQGLGNNIKEKQKFIGKNSRNDFIYIFLFFFSILESKNNYFPCTSQPQGKKEWNHTTNSKK